MKRTLIIPALTIGTLLISSMAFAHGQRGTGDRAGYCNGPNRGMGYGMSSTDHEQRIAQRLNFLSLALDLTDAQQAQLKDLEQKHWQDRQDMRDRMDANRKVMRELAQSDDFDEAAFRTKATQQADLKTDMLAGRTNMKQQLLAILTPDQRAKAEKLWALNNNGGPAGMMGSGRGMMGSGDGMGHHGDRDNFRGEGHHGRNWENCRAQMSDDN